MAVEKTKKTKGNKGQFWRVFLGKSVLTKLCLGIIVVFVLGAILAPVILPYTPFEQNLLQMNKGPSAAHWLGTDQLGRDLLTRLLYGARVSLMTGLLSSLWAAVVGTVVGLISGYFGGWINTVIMRLTDAMLSIPPLIFTMVLASMVSGNLLGISFVIGLSIVPGYVRMVNGLVGSLRENDYVTAASLIGQRKSTIMFKHLLPNCFASLIVIFTMNLGTAVMLEATLSYLGVGIAPPTPAWGVMVADGYKYLFNVPRLAILPGLCVMLLVIAFNIVGDGLRDALDPRLRGKL